MNGLERIEKACNDAQVQGLNYVTLVVPVSTTWRWRHQRYVSPVRGMPRGEIISDTVPGCVVASFPVVPMLGWLARTYRKLASAAAQANAEQ